MAASGPSDTRHQMSSPSAPVLPSPTLSDSGRSPQTVSQTIRFSEYVRQERQLGFDGEDNHVHYMTERALQCYWTVPKINALCLELLKNCDKFIPLATLIKSKYIRVFSTLVDIGHLSMLEKFIRFQWIDAAIPALFSRGVPASDSLPEQQIFGQFFETHWLFFPLELPFDQPPHEIWLSVSQVLPIKSREIIRETDDTLVWKVTLDPDCSGLPEPRKCRLPGTENCFVHKVYKGHGTSSNYRAELAAYNILANNDGVNNLLNCYGLFLQGRNSNLLLDWMNSGSLGEYLKSLPPPQTKKQATDIWDSMCGLLDALCHVHGARSRKFPVGGDPVNYYLIVHQDIKLENILVERTDPSNPYKLRLVLADFGYSAAQVVCTGDYDADIYNRHGDRVFCAPECCHPLRQIQKIPTRIDDKADIFSMGAVFSLVAVWIAFGHEKLDEYYHRRREGHRTLAGFPGSGYEGCFHARNAPLPAVADMHREVLRQLGSFDQVTPKVLHMVENHMLEIEKEHRWHAIRLFNNLCQIIVDEKKDDRGVVPSVPTSSAPPLLPTLIIPDHPPIRALRGSPITIDGSSVSDIIVSTRPGSPLLSSPGRESKFTDTTASLQLPGSPMGSTRSRRLVSTTYPPLTISQAWECILEAKKSPTRSTSRLQEILTALKRRVGDRDHLFFVDDTPSLRKLHAKVVDTFKVLSYLAKRLDNVKVQLAFASTAGDNPRCCRKTTPLVRDLKKHSYSQEQDMIENSLTRLINKTIIPQLTLLKTKHKPLTVMVLTDAAWGSEEPKDFKIDNTISRVTEKIESMGFDPQHVTFQFIQFGDDAHGKRHLNYLDDFCDGDRCVICEAHVSEWSGTRSFLPLRTLTPIVIPRDIVDTRKADGNVYHMFLGSTVKRIDKVADDPPREANGLGIV